MTIKFPDVSHYQAGINLSTAVAVIAKATEGTSMVDAYYPGFKAQAAKTNAPFLAYHFLRHSNVLAQATHNVAYIGTGQSLMLDVESEEGLPDPTLSEVLSFADSYPAASGGGKVVCAYIPKWFWQGHWGSPSLTGLTSRGISLISSQYPPGGYTENGPGWAPYGGVTPAIWQYTASASFGGVSKVDFNAFKGTVDDLRQLWGLEDGMAFEDTVQFKALNERVYAIFSGDNSDWTKDNGDQVHEGNPLWALLRQMQADIEALQAGEVPPPPTLVAHTHDGGETGPAVATP